MRAHEAGALHGDIGNRGPAWLRTPGDVNALVPQLWPRNVTRGAGRRAGRRRADVTRPRRRVRHPGVRPGRGRLPRALPGLPGRLRRRRRLLRRQGVPVPGGRPDDRRGGAEPRRLLRRRAGHGAVGRHAAGADRLPRQQQVRGRADAGRWTPGSGRIVVDSFEEIDRLTDAGPRARAYGPRVLIRVTVGVEAHTHEFIATAHEDQKFGFSLAGGAAAAARRQDPRRGRAGAARPPLAHRLADLRHQRLRGRRPPGARRCRRRSATSTGSSCPSSTSAAASASRTPPRTTRPTPHELAKRLREIVDARVRGASGWPCRGCRSSRAGRSSGRPSFTLYEVGTVKDVDGLRTLRQRRRRDERQHPHRALRRRVLGDAGLPGLGAPSRCSPAWSESTVRAGTSW